MQARSLLVWCGLVFCSVLVDAEYNVKVVDRSIGADKGPVISFALNTSSYPYVFNPAWLPLPGVEGGGLIVRVNSDGDQSDLLLLEARFKKGDPPRFQRADPSRLFRRHNTSEFNIYAIDDPRATFRPATGKYYATYQNIGVDGRQTWIAQTSSPLDNSSWVQSPHAMFPKVVDCGTCLFFPNDTESVPGSAMAIVTFGSLRGGNLSLATSHDDSLTNWEIVSPLLQTRPGHWDDRTLSASASPVRLSDGSWLLLYNVDNKWPVQHPLPIPWYGRCALGWAILDGDDPTKVLARSEAPLLYAELPFEMEGFSPHSIYAESITPEGNDTFVVYVVQCCVGSC